MATRISHPRDPPGHSSVYIMPGRVWFILFQVECGKTLKFKNELKLIWNVFAKLFDLLDVRIIFAVF